MHDRNAQRFTIFVPNCDFDSQPFNTQWIENCTPQDDGNDSLEIIQVEETVFFPSIEPFQTNSLFVQFSHFSAVSKNQICKKYDSSLSVYQLLFRPAFKLVYESFVTSQ